jgi:hypothetical protein
MACNHNRALNEKPNCLGPLPFGSVGRAVLSQLDWTFFRVFAFGLENSVPLPLISLPMLSGGPLVSLLFYCSPLVCWSILLIIFFRWHATVAIGFSMLSRLFF